MYNIIIEMYNIIKQIYLFTSTIQQKYLHNAFNYSLIQSKIADQLILPMLINDWL